MTRARIIVQITIYHRLRIGRDGRLNQYKVYDISYLVREYGPRIVKEKLQYTLKVDS